MELEQEVTTEGEIQKAAEVVGQWKGEAIKLKQTMDRRRAVKVGTMQVPLPQPETGSFSRVSLAAKVLRVSEGLDLFNHNQVSNQLRDYNAAKIYVSTRQHL